MLMGKLLCVTDSNTVPNKMHGSPPILVFCKYESMHGLGRVLHALNVVHCIFVNNVIVLARSGGPKSLIRAFVRALVTVGCAC